MLSSTFNFQQILAHHSTPTLVVDGVGQVQWQNTAATEAFTPLTGQSILALCAGSAAHSQFQHSLTAAMHGIAATNVPITLQLGHGQPQPHHFSAVGIAGADLLIRHVLLTVVDAISSSATSQQLAISQQRFTDFAANSPDWLWEADASGIFTYISPGITGVLGYQPSQLMGHLWLPSLFGEAEDPLRDQLESHWHQAQPFTEVEVWTRDRAGSRVCLRLSATPVVQAGQFSGYRGVATNVTGTKLDREHTYRLATTDHLTGLLNWLRFKEELERGLALSQRHSAQGVLVLIDLDRFKELNDTHGHEAGDKILIAVSDILRESVRSTDVVARRGGDEFAILLHSLSVAEAQLKIDAVIQKIATLRLDYAGIPLMITMSAGMVTFPHAGATGEQLIMSADLAMYRAKDMGRNRLYIDTADSVTLGRGSIAAQLKGLERLKECLATDNFDLHYQAIVSTRPRQRPLFEALLRIADADGKPLPPPLFIEAAEHFGLIQQLDMAVVRKVFKAQYELQQSGTNGADVSINLSSRSLGDPEVTTQLKAIHRTYPVDPNRIIFEVTETMALHDPAQMRDISTLRSFIMDLRSMGFRFALDDFGTGFTSFKYLKVLPVDIVKIDGEYIKDILTDAEDKLFVKSMVDLCNGMGIATIAEFVENEACMNLLIELGIDYGQGWHFAKPLPNLAELSERFKGKSMADFGTAPELITRMLQATSPAITQSMQQANLTQAPIKTKPKKTPKASA